VKWSAAILDLMVRFLCRDCCLQCTWIRRRRGRWLHTLSYPEFVSTNILVGKHGSWGKENNWTRSVERSSQWVGKNSRRHTWHHWSGL